MDLKLLIKELKFPENVIFDNTINLPGEEFFLRGLFELVTDSAKHEIANQFGRDFSAQSRVFNFFIDHIYDTFII